MLKKLMLSMALVACAVPAMAMNAANALEIAQDRAMAAAEASGVMVTPYIAKVNGGGWSPEILATSCDVQVVAINGGYTARDAVQAVQSVWTNAEVADAAGGMVLFANVATYNGCPG